MSLIRVLSLVPLAARRMWSQRLLMLCLLLGLVAAVGLLSSIPLYADAAHNRLLQGELGTAGPGSDDAAGGETAPAHPPFSFLWSYVGAWHGNVTWDKYAPVNTYLAEQAPALVGLPLGLQVRHVATEKMRLFPGQDAAFVPDEPLLWASLGFATGLLEGGHLQLLEGDLPAARGPGEAVDVLISLKTAETLGLQVGEQYILMAPDLSQVAVRIAGVWQAADEAGEAWFYEPSSFDEVLLTSEDAFVSQVVPGLKAPVATAAWYQAYDGSRVRPASVNGLLADVATVEARVTALLANTTLDVSPVPALQSYGRAASLLALMLTVFSLPVLGLVVYFVSLISGMVVQREQSEIAVMRGRGISRGKIVSLYLLEGLLVGGVGLAGGLLLGRWMAQVMSRTRTFLDLGVLTAGEGGTMAIVYTPTSVAYGLLGVVLTLVALLVPALLVSRHSIVTLRQEQARSLQLPVWQRYYLDLILLVPPLYGWYQMARQGSAALGAEGGDPFSNPLLFLVPVLFCFALGLLFLRFFPLLMRLLSSLAAWVPGTTLLLTLRQLARSPAQYAGPLLLLTLTVSLATFTASMAVTLDSHLGDQVYYQVGADLALVELGESTEETEETETETEEEPLWLFLPVEDHLEVPGVRAAARVGSYSARVNIGGRQQAGQILGIDRVDLPRVAFFRADFAYNESLGELMNRLAAASDGILVSSDFLAQQGLAVGDPLRLTVGASGVYAEASFTVVGSLELFPTLYPQDGPFFVANLDHIHNALGGAYPYDVWLATDPAVESEEIVEGVRDLGLVVVTARDARQAIARAQTQPERQGLFGLLSVGFIAAAVLTVIGFLLYAIVSFQRRFIELGMLRAIGLSKKQMAGYLAGELAALILTGVSLGTGLGVWASTLFIPYFQVGEGKTALVPPFVIQLAWEQLGIILAIFAAMFVLAVVALAVLLNRMRVFEAVKLGETV
ncbi:MAG: FtsX-like permease family protein [Anaerolineae bacterium]|nr:FtsX-like permease family protein [Anaerolineae bacterium]